MSRPCLWWEWLMSALSTKRTLLDTARVNFLDLARINLFKFFIPDNKLGTHIRRVNWSNFGEFFFWFDFNLYLYLMVWLEIGNLHKAANGPNHKKIWDKKWNVPYFKLWPCFWNVLLLLLLFLFLHCDDPGCVQSCYLQTVCIKSIKPMSGLKYFFNKNACMDPPSPRCVQSLESLAQEMRATHGSHAQIWGSMWPEKLMPLGSLSLCRISEFKIITAWA